MSENLENAMYAALTAKPTEFKDAIYAEIEQKVQDALHMTKMEVANAVFTNKQDESENTDSQFKTEEDNIDEDL